MTAAWRTGWRVVAALLAALPVVATTAAAGAVPTARVDALFETLDREGPGYAIAVLKNGQPVHARGYGLADIVSRRPITADTAFNLASLSKQFTGAAVALAWGRGWLDLDDPLSRHRPEAPAFMARITLAHLVYMTSGLPEYHTLPSPKGGWRSEDRFTVGDAISAVERHGRLVFEPGTRWSYSNTDYQLLADVVARRSGTSFADFLAQNLFVPLGMRHTWVDAPIDAARPERAVGYRRRAEQWVAAPRLSPHYGGSGVFSSLSDLARWVRALHVDRSFGPAFTNRMLATRRFGHDKVNDAMGLVHGRHRGVPTVWYEGSDDGASTYLLHLPETAETVICLANFEAADCRAKALAIADLLLAERGPPAQHFPRN